MPRRLCVGGATSLSMMKCGHGVPGMAVYSSVGMMQVDGVKGE